MKKTRLFAVLLSVIAVVALCLAFTACDGLQLPARYTVTFDANGGTLIGESSAKVFEGDTIKNVPTAEKADHNFVGWFLNAAGGAKVVDFETFEVLEDLTFYAGYVSTIDPSTDYETIATEAAVTVADAALGNVAGYKLKVSDAGWYKVVASDCVEGAGAWSVVIGTGYEPVLCDLELTRLNAAGANDDVYYLAKGTYIVEVSAPLTFTVEPCTIYFVTFDANGGCLNGDAEWTTQVLVAAEGSTFSTSYLNTVLNPSKEGYEFIGWYTSTEADGRAVDFSGYIIDASATFYACYVESTDPSENYETISTNKEVVVEEASLENVAGYKLKVTESGWYKVVASESPETIVLGQEYEVSMGALELISLPSVGTEGNVYRLEKGVYVVEVSAPLTFSVESCNIYIVTFNANGGCFNGDAEWTTQSYIVAEGSAFSEGYIQDVLNPAKEGLIFCGWYLTANWSGEKVQLNYYTFDASASTVLYAKYATVSGHKSFALGEVVSANGSWGNADLYTIEIAEDGWYMVSSEATWAIAIGTEYVNGYDGLELARLESFGAGDNLYYLEAGNYYVEAGDACDFCVEACTVYTVTLDANGGCFFGMEDWTTQAYVVEEGGLLPSGAAYLSPEKEDSMFVAWYTNAECDGMAVNFDYFTVTYDATLYAAYAPLTDPAADYAEIATGASVTVAEADWENVAGYKLVVAETGFYELSVSGEEASLWSVTIGTGYTFAWGQFTLDAIWGAGENDNIYYLEAGTYYVEVNAPLTFTFAAPADTYYVITLDANGGCFWDDPENTNMSFIVKEDGLLPESLSELAPSKAGYEFKGWYANAECEGIVITLSAFTATYNATLYAGYTALEVADPSENYAVIALGAQVEVAEADWENVAGYKFVVEESGYYTLSVSGEEASLYDVVIGSSYEYDFWGSLELQRINAVEETDNLYYLEAGTYVVEVYAPLTFAISAAEAV